MSFARDEGQQLIGEMLERLFAVEYDLETRRETLSGNARDVLRLWPQLCAQGVLGVALPESEGGAGGKVRDLAVVQEAAGAALVVEPLLHSMLAISLLREGHSFADEVERIFKGEMVVAIAMSESDDAFESNETRASGDDEAIRLTGQKPVVRHGDVANALIVAADYQGGTGFFLVDAKADGVEKSPLRLIDGSSGAALRLTEVPASLIAMGTEINDKVKSLVLVCLAAEASGICKKLVLDTAKYLKDRSQFGAPLASFQALQHKLADMHIAAEEVRCLVDRAVDAADRGAPDALKLACAAKVIGDQAGKKIGHDAVQLHGGMGVSDELNISHMAKRLAGIRHEFASTDALSRYISGFGDNIV